MVRGPSNTVVVSGSTVTFTCVTSLAIDELCWAGRFKRHYDTWTTLCICNTYGCRHPRYSVHASVQNRLRHHSLMIDSCNATDSGLYGCAECRTAGDTRRTAHLVVIGTLSALIFKHIVRNVLRPTAYSCSMLYIRY